MAFNQKRVRFCLENLDVTLKLVINRGFIVEKLEKNNQTKVCFEKAKRFGNWQKLIV